ncbi:hypothetical protein RXV95_15320 [Novosphingobium sp. ZN18A2]|uniref:hypothetical protein n=1 Tax=Novosphingobium sp. ZN18A2 TaxID=3079861 RepID=UPI0030D0CF92
MNQPEHSAQNPPPPTLGIALLIWLGVIVAIIGFVAIGYALSLVPLYAGFTLVWYWANVDKLSFTFAPATVVGAVAGTANAWLLQWAAANHNTALIVAALAILAVVLLLSIMERAQIFANASYMLFVTVACAPLLQQGENFVQVIETILLGAVYFGGLVWIGMKAFGGSKTEQAAEERLGVEA